jgi:fructose-1,6-bisphosphatase/inositol monophosphatase family enzyme
MASLKHTTQTAYGEELEFARTLAHEAGTIMRRYFDADQNKKLKSDKTYVTVADMEINRMVIEKIAKRFPGDGVVGEEESSADYAGGRRWICDPIDGTFSYIIGAPTSMFSLCLVVDGQPAVAVTYDPYQDKTYTAVKNQGSFCNGVKLHVSQDNIDTAILAVAPAFIRRKYINEPFMRNLLAYDKQLAVFDGAVFRGCMIASGRIAGFPHPKLKPWDVAAIHLLVEEAGGKVTDINGRPLEYLKYFEGAVISNGVIHDELLALFL